MGRSSRERIGLRRRFCLTRLMTISPKTIRFASSMPLSMLLISRRSALKASFPKRRAGLATILQRISRSTSMAISTRYSHRGALSASAIGIWNSSG